MERTAPPTARVQSPVRTVSNVLRMLGLRSASRASHPRRILALCLGGIGDTVLAFAALRDLRRACPHDHITALAMWPQAAHLLEDLRIFDEVLQHNFQRERLWRSAWTTFRLRLRCFDVSLLAFPANRFEYNVLSWLLGARQRFGHTYLRDSDWGNLRFLLTDRVAQRRGRHTVDENRAIVSRFVTSTSNCAAETGLGRLEAEYHVFAKRMLGHVRPPRLGVHAGCSTYKGHVGRRWHARRFGELCRRAHQELGLAPIIFGAPDEIDLKLEIQAECPEAFLAHGQTIRHTAAMIQTCNVFISNDSSLAHIAAALDVPVAMVCGPTDPTSIGPYGHPDWVISADLGCSPCFQVGRQPLRCVNPRRFACMEAVSVELALEALGRLLARRGPPCVEVSKTLSLPVVTAA